MYKVDQEMRKKASKGLITWDEKIDRVNTENLKKIIADIGWPTISKVGVKSSKVAWLLAQHADHDIAFQKLALHLIREAVKLNDVEPKEVAYLTDRIRLKEGRKQIYGTQFTKKNGDFIPLPLQDPERVNVRREKFGLGTIEDYKNFFI